MPKKPSMVGDQENIKARHDWEEEMKRRAEEIGDLEYEKQKDDEEAVKEEER